jgi:hypothetical protein
MFIVPTPVFANGSPIDGSDILATGNIRMIQKKEISLDEENLQVILEGDYAVVHAEYHLMNHGKKVTVTYGFPVDYKKPEEQEFSEELKNTGKPLQKVVIEADGKSLKTRKYLEPEKKGKKEKQPDYLRTWLITDLEFGEAEQKVVTVSYRVKNFLDDWIFTKSFKPQFSDRTFSYVLSPSGNWGDGIVRKLSISIDSSKIKTKGGVIKKVSPKGYSVTDDIIRWEFENFNLKKAKNLKVVYDDTARLMSDFVASERLPSHLVKQVKGLSSLKDPAHPGKYDPSMVLDKDLGTAWCEGVVDDGMGQSLSFELKDSVIFGIGIINGYAKNKAVYEGNNRIKRIKVITVQKNGEKREEVVDLPTRDFNKLNRQAVAPFIDWIADFGDAYATTKSIALVIEEVYPGTKHRDTCISEVYLIGSPKTQGMQQ